MWIFPKYVLKEALLSFVLALAAFIEVYITPEVVVAVYGS